MKLYSLMLSFKMFPDQCFSRSIFLESLKNVVCDLVVILEH